MEQKLRQLIKEAMIQKKETGNTNRYQTFKNILEKAQKIAKEKRADVIENSLVIDAVKKEIKQLEDTLQYCKEGDTRYADLQECIACAKELLPAMASKEDIESYLREINPERNVGICMKLLKIHFKDTLDGKTASLVSKEYTEGRL